MQMVIIRRHAGLPCYLLLCSLLVSSGCATTQEGQAQQAGGAAMGALMGAAMGALIGGSWKSALIGAAAGAALGWTAATIAYSESTQVRSAKDDRKMYGLTAAVSSPTIKIRQATVNPGTVKPGEQIEIATEYSLYLPKGIKEAEVEEVIVLTKDGKEVYKLPAETRTRCEGGFSGRRGVNLPKNCKPGTYVVEHRTSTGTSYDVTTSTFVVGS